MLACSLFNEHDKVSSVICIGKTGIGKKVFCLPKQCESCEEYIKVLRHSKII